MTSNSKSIRDEYEWVAFAHCGAEDAPPMHPTPSDSIGIELAKNWCGDCAVINECREHALDRNEPDGVWGGLTLEERQRVRRNRSRRKPLIPTHNPKDTQ